MTPALRRAAPLLLVALALLAATGCAIGKRENRRTLNALDAHAAPEGTAGRWALAPVALPAALVAAVADAVVVHPSTVFDDAWRDTVDLLWTSREESRFRRALFVPLATLATPVVYVGDWLGRAVFAIPPHEADATDAAPREGTVDGADAAGSSDDEADETEARS